MLLSSASVLHRVPSPTSTGRLNTTASVVSVGRRLRVHRRTTPVVRSAMTMVWRLDFTRLVLPRCDRSQRFLNRPAQNAATVAKRWTLSQERLCSQDGNRCKRTKREDELPDNSSGSLDRGRALRRCTCSDDTPVAVFVILRHGMTSYMRTTSLASSFTLYWSASPTCSAPTESAPARSAIVRATFRTRSYPRALSPRR